MDTTTPDITPQSPAPKPAKKIKRHSKWWSVGVSLAFVLTVAAWVSMVVSEQVSLWCAIGGAVASIVSLTQLGRGLLRDVAITCLIASAVLLVVFGIFYFGIHILLSSL